MAIKFQRVIRSAVAILIVTLSYTILPYIAYGQFSSGLFGSKMEVVLNRKRPPAVYLMGTAINVQASAQRQSDAAYAQQFADMLQSELTKNDKRLKLEAARPETLITCRLNYLDTSEKWEQRTTTEHKKVGETQEWNQKKQKNETKDVYKDVEVTRRYKVVSGSIQMSYQVKDMKTGQILDSGNPTLPYSRDFLDGNGAPETDYLKQILIQVAVGQVVPHLVPTSEPVKIMLAQGKLKDIAKLGQAGLWQRMVEAYEVMPPLKKPQDDAYREFNIGVGYEALAYQAEELETTKKFLDKAATHYGKALEMKPTEKYFVEPQKRIEQAITQYRTISDQLVAYAAYKAPPVVQKQEVTSSNQKQDAAGSKNLVQRENKSPANGTGKQMTNQEVIALAAKGLDEANLIATIKQAPAVNFDLGPEGLSQLLENKVSNTVISAMRVRQVGQRRTTSNGPRRKRP